MSDSKQAMMELVKGVVGLSEATRGLAATGEPDDVQLAGLKAKTSQIMAALKQLENPEPFAIEYDDVPEPMATSASSKPTVKVSSIDDAF